jgi:hypothetical protein
MRRLRALLCLWLAVASTAVHAAADKRLLSLNEAETHALDALDQGRRIGPDPANFDF